MNAWILNYLQEHSYVLIGAVTFCVVVALGQWRRVRITELELAFKQDLLDRGFTIAEIDHLLASRSTTKKGLLEQFGALSGGAKAGLLITTAIVLIVFVSSVSQAIHHYTFWTRVTLPQQAQVAPR